MYKVLHKQILLPNPGTFIPAPDRYVLGKTGLRVVFQPARVPSPIFHLGRPRLERGKRRGRQPVARVWQYSMAIRPSPSSGSIHH